MTKVYMNPQTRQTETVTSIRRAMELIRAGWKEVQAVVVTKDDGKAAQK